jgi:D-alanine-D-alanine ligase
MDKSIVVIFGGESFQHEVSLYTGYDVSKELIKTYTNIFFIGITKTGIWKYSHNISNIILYSQNINEISINEQCDNVYQIGDGKINSVPIFCAFLSTHNQIGEDGTLQGFLSLNKIHFTGSTLMNSAICFNKHFCKSVANAININIVPHLHFQKCEIITSLENEIINDVSLLNCQEYIVKVNKGASSIGVYSCSNSSVFKTVKKCIELDDEVLVEEKIVAMRELFVGIIIVNGKIIISDIGEFVNDKEIFTFDKKYGNTKTEIRLAKDIPNNISTCIKKISNKLCRTLNMKSYCIIEFFYTEDGTVYFNEINTFPGLSESSLFPIMFKSKYNYGELLKVIIDISLSKLN